MADIDRLAFGLKETEMEFTRTDQDLSLKTINMDKDSIVASPINYVLGTFKQDFMKNEIMAYEFFLQLNEALDTFTNKLEDSFYYDEMEIVKLFREILIRYKNWATTMRQNIFLAKDKMQEVQDIVEKDYVTKSEMENIQAEFEQQVKEMEEGEVGLVRNKSGYRVVVIPQSICERRNIDFGDKLFFRKVAKQVSATC